MFISSTASRALRPFQGSPAPCAATPSKRYSTDTKPVPRARPQLTERLLDTWVNKTASTPSKSPSLAYQALVPNNSSAIPGQITIVPGSPLLSIISLTANAATMLTAWPELCPSP